MCPPGVPYIAVAPVVMSWAVAGQQVVFLYCMLQARVTQTTFPIATPRGRSVSFPIQGTMVTYEELFSKTLQIHFNSFHENDIFFT